MDEAVISYQEGDPTANTKTPNYYKQEKKDVIS